MQNLGENYTFLKVIDWSEFGGLNMHFVKAGKWICMFCVSAALKQLAAVKTDGGHNLYASCLALTGWLWAYMKSSSKKDLEDINKDIKVKNLTKEPT